MRVPRSSRRRGPGSSATPRESRPFFLFAIGRVRTPAEPAAAQFDDAESSLSSEPLDYSGPARQTVHHGVLLARGCRRDAHSIMASRYRLMRTGRVRLITALMLATIPLFPACQDAGESDTSSGERTASGATTPLVQDYVEIADTASAETTVIDEKLLADALRKLAAALGALNLADVELQVALRVAAEHVLTDPQPVGTTAAVRNSLISAAEAIETGSQGDGSLRRSAESLREDLPLADQAAAIREFLSISGPALRRVAAG